jgi:probable HAF family extracellular repeat protein
MKSFAQSLCNSLCFCLLSSLVSSAGGAHFQYRLIDLGTLPGGYYSSATHINNRGEIVGIAEDAIRRVPFLFTTNGRMIKLPFPDTMYGPEVWDFNDLGLAIVYGKHKSQINVGGWSIGDGTLLLDRTQALEMRHAVGHLDAPTFGFALNNLGDLVGASIREDDFRYHPFLFHDGMFGFLDEAHGSPEWLQAEDMNDSGAVIAQGQAFSGTQSVVHTFLMVNGTTTDIGTMPGADWVWGHRINNRGSIIGTTSQGGFEVRGFLWQDGVMRDVGPSPMVAINNFDDMLGYDDNGEYAIISGGVTRSLKPLLQGTRAWQWLTIRSLNDQGQMVGEAVFRGETHAVLITPIKQPK